MKGIEPNSPSPEWIKPLTVIVAGPLFSQFIAGTSIGQVAIMLPRLGDDDSLYLTKAEVTWIGSVSVLATGVSICISESVARTCGRIRSTQICYLLCCVGFAVLSTARSFVTLMLGRFIVGFAIGFGFVSSVHIAEISPPVYRGLFLSLVSLFNCLGHIFVHSFGCYMSWKMTTASLFVISFLGLLMSLPLYESPQWLVQQGNLALVRRSLEQTGCLEVDAMFDELVADTSNREIESLSLKTFKAPEVWKPFLINVGLATFACGGCTYLLIIEPVSFIKEFPTAFDPFSFAVVLSLARLVSLVFGLYLLRRLGRRTIGAISGFSTAAVLLGILVCLRFEKVHPDLFHKYNWMYNFAFILLVVTTNTGMFQLPWMLPNEMFPARVRSTMSLFNLFLIYVMILVLIKVYHTVIDGLGLECTIFMFAAFAFMFAVLSQTVLVETQEKTLDEIGLEFRRDKQHEKKAAA